MFWQKKLPLLAIATPTVRDLWVAICIGEWQQMSVLLKKWPKSDGYFFLALVVLAFYTMKKEKSPILDVWHQRLYKCYSLLYQDSRSKFMIIFCLTPVDTLRHYTP